MSSQLGIAKFWCKVEGKEPVKDYFVNSEWYYDELSLGTRQTQALRTVIDSGSISSIKYAFYWRRTPQGHDYWYRRYIGVEPISGEDIRYMEYLLREHSSEN